jgi:hypothetical protein
MSWRGSAGVHRGNVIHVGDRGQLGLGSISGLSRALSWRSGVVNNTRGNAWCAKDFVEWVWLRLPDPTSSRIRTWRLGKKSPHRSKINGLENSLSAVISCETIC